MKKVKHTINWHITSDLIGQAYRFLVPHTAKKDGYYTYIVRFNKSCLYCDSELNQIRMGEDCKDWNKLLGISYKPYLNARKNSVMVGWRHLPNTQRIEVQPYLHHHKTGDKVHEPFKPKSLKLNTFYKIRLGPESISIVELKVTKMPTHSNGYTFEYEEKAEMAAWLFRGVVRPSRFRRQINSYFGGNQTAPQTITFDLNRGFVKYNK
jgi:hypothetical protein